MARINPVVGKLLCSPIFFVFLILISLELVDLMLCRIELFHNGIFIGTV